MQIAEEAQNGLSEDVVEHTQVFGVELHSDLLHHIRRHFLLLALPLAHSWWRSHFLLLLQNLLVILAGIDLKPDYLAEVPQ